jgi:hypothetical protein
MNILDLVMNAQDGAAVRQLGSQFGLGEAQTQSALSALVPALAAGFQKNVQSPDGLASLVSALSAGNHQRYVSDPATLADGGAVTDGNGILGHVFGSKDLSRAVASKAAAQTGLSSDLMKQMLPLAATMVMGAIAQQQRSGAGPAAPANLAGSGGLGDMLSSLVDQNRDGSVVDDIGNIVSSFLRKQ